MISTEIQQSAKCPSCFCNGFRRRRFCRRRFCSVVSVFSPMCLLSMRFVIVSSGVVVVTINARYIDIAAGKDRGEGKWEEYC